MKNFTKRLFFALFALCFANFACAHSLKIFASQDGENVRIKSFFYGNSACMNCDVKISQNGAEVMRAKTDETGVALVSLENGEYEIEIYAGSGHAKKINFTVQGVANAKTAQNGAKNKILLEQNSTQNSARTVTKTEQTAEDETEKDEINLRNFALSLAIIFVIFGVLYALKRRRK